MPAQESSTIFDIGAICFGLVIGWVTYRTLRRTSDVGLSDIATVIGAVGGAAVLAIFELGDSFGWYAIGLLVGFFGYIVIAFILDPQETKEWMGGAEPIGRRRTSGGSDKPIDRVG